MMTIICLIIFLFICTIFDLITRKVPDWVNLCGLFCAICIHGIVPAVLGFLAYFTVAYLLFTFLELVFHESFTYGGGDVKMLGAAGSFLGYSTVFHFIPIVTGLSWLMVAILSLIHRRGLSIPFAPMVLLMVSILIYM